MISAQSSLFFSTCRDIHFFTLRIWKSLFFSFLNNCTEEYRFWREKYIASNSEFMSTKSPFFGFSTGPRGLFWSQFLFPWCSSPTDLVRLFVGGSRPLLMKRALKLPFFFACSSLRGSLKMTLFFLRHQIVAFFSHQGRCNHWILFFFSPLLNRYLFEPIVLSFTCFSFPYIFLRYLSWRYFKGIGLFPFFKNDISV